MPETGPNFPLDARIYKHWQRRATLKELITIARDNADSLLVDRPIIAPNDVTYRLMACGGLGELLRLPGEPLIQHVQANGGANADAKIAGVALVESALVKNIPDRVLLRTQFEDWPDLELDEEINWSCAAGVVFEYSYVDTWAMQEVGMALLSNGDVGSYSLQAVYRLDGTASTNQTNGTGVRAADFDAFNKNLQTLIKLAGEPIQR